MSPIVQGAAARLGVDPAWILGLGFESTWLADKALDRNNPFGVTKPDRKSPQGRTPESFPSLQDAMTYWEQHFGDWVRGSRTSEEFIRNLEDASSHQPYNSEDLDPPYQERLRRGIKSMQTRINKR